MAVTLLVSVPNAPLYTITVPWHANMDIQRLMELAYDQQHGTPEPFSFALQFYGTPPTPGYGYLVVMVNGLWEDLTPPSDAYWWLTVNGVSLNVGIDEYIVLDGDGIMFAYTTQPADTATTGHDAAKVSAKVNKAS